MLNSVFFIYDYMHRLGYQMNKDSKTKENKPVRDLIEDPEIAMHVSKLAGHYYNMIRADRRGLITKEDLISAGYEGAIMAAGKYKPGSGASFKTYSTEWIRGEMIREMIFYVGKEALLIEDVRKLSASAGIDPATSSDDGFDISDIPEDEQIRIITSKLAEYNLTKIEITVYLAVNGIGCDKVTNLKALGRQLDMRETQIRRIKQSAEDKVKRGIA